MNRVSSRYLSDEAHTLHRELSERNVDLLIARRVGIFTDEKLGFEILYDSSFVVVADARNPWARRRRIALAELMNESWVMPPPEGVLGPTYLEVFRASGLTYPRTAVFAAPPGVRLNLLSTGRLLTIVPISVLRLSKRPEIKVLPVTLQCPSVPVGIVTLRNRTLSPVAKLLSTMPARLGSLWREENSRRHVGMWPDSDVPEAYGLVC